MNKIPVPFAIALLLLSLGIPLSLAQSSSDFMNELQWSNSGPIANMRCVFITEDAEPATSTWNDNYLCTINDYGMEWTHTRSSLPGKTCVQFDEPREPENQAWYDNNLCTANNLHLAFSNSGEISGKKCVRIYEPADPDSWHDNYLCGDQPTAAPTPTTPSTPVSTTQPSTPAGPPTRQINYCATGNKFITDLDGEGADLATCENAKYPNGTLGQFKWTGTKCCGDPEASPESYNDRDKACWEGKAITPVTFLPDFANTILVYSQDGNARFNGCNISATIFNRSNDGLLILREFHQQNKALINDSPYCTLDSTSTYYCSFREKWLPTGGKNRAYLKNATYDVSNNETHSQQECCTQTECWNGKECVADQISTPIAANAFGTKRCINGNWENAENLAKKALLNGADGFCGQQSQCLYDAAGTSSDPSGPALISGSPQCVNKDRYKNDDLCFDGNWGTRTQRVALKLLDIKQTGNYTLYCDSAQKVFNDLNYISPSGAQISTYFTNDKANNACVLRQGQNVIIGISFNTQITDTLTNDLFGINQCRNLTTETNYRKCDDAGKLWHNSNGEMLIFSNSGIYARTTPDFSTLFLSFLKNPLQAIRDALEQKLTTQQPTFSVGTSYQNIPAKFQRLYLSEAIAQPTNRKVFGVMNSPTPTTAVIEYTNFNSDICQYARDSVPLQDQASGIYCNKDGTTYRLILKGDTLTAFNPDTYWADFTSKLRIS